MPNSSGWGTASSTQASAASTELRSRSPQTLQNKIFTGTGEGGSSWNPVRRVEMYGGNTDMDHDADFSGSSMQIQKGGHSSLQHIGRPGASVRPEQQQTAMAEQGGVHQGRAGQARAGEKENWTDNTLQNAARGFGRTGNQYQPSLHASLPARHVRLPSRFAMLFGVLMLRKGVCT